MVESTRSLFFFPSSRGDYRPFIVSKVIPNKTQKGVIGAKSLEVSVGFWETRKSFAIVDSCSERKLKDWMLTLCALIPLASLMGKSKEQLPTSAIAL